MTASSSRHEGSDPRPGLRSWAGRARAPGHFFELRPESRTANRCVRKIRRCLAVPPVETGLYLSRDAARVRRSPRKHSRRLGLEPPPKCLSEERLWITRPVSDATAGLGQSG